MKIDEYVALAVATMLTGIVSGIGGAMAWFKKSKEVLHTRINKVKTQVETFADLKAGHDVRLERVETCQENTSEWLKELKAGQALINEKIDNFYRDVMSAIGKT